MAVYVSYVDSAPGGQAAAARVIERVHRSQALANARGAVPGVTAHVGGVDDDADVGDLLDTSNGTLVAWVAPAPDAAQQAAWRLRLHDAWRAWHDASGRPATAWQNWWASVHDATATTAVDRWAYSQIALGDVIAGGGVAALVTTVQRAAAIAHIARAVSQRGREWHAIVAADGAKRLAWSGGSVAAGQRIATDLLDAAWAARDADGTRRVTAATVPAGLTPDTPTLR